MVFVVVALAVLAVIALLLVFRYRTALIRVRVEKEALSDEKQKVVERFKGIVDAEEERERVLAALQQEQAALREAGERDRAARAQEMARMLETLQREQSALHEAGEREVQARAHEIARMMDTLRQEQAALRDAGEREVATRAQEIARMLAAFQQERVTLREASEREVALNTQALAHTELKLEIKAGELDALNTRIAELQSEFKLLNEEADIQEFGFYKPRYDFADSARYQTELESIRGQQKFLLQSKAAAACHIAWTVNGSKVEGQRSVNQTLKLMLRAFNGECDAAVAKVKYNNVAVMEARITKAYHKINSLAEIQKCTISQAYLTLKLQELYLAHEYQEKVQEEREEQRQIRERMREEEIAQREFEKARLESEREEVRYEKALARAREEVERSVGAKQAELLATVALLEQRLADAREKKERAISQAQLTKSGHVYIISNIGSFGEHVYKIGMTRRLDPLERVRELSTAPVPFQYDVHAVIFSDDAPALENHLHRLFRTCRVNRVNERKEFFRIPLDFIVTAVREKHGQIEVTRLAEAVEYRKTLAILEEERRAAAGSATLPGSHDANQLASA